MDLWMRWVIMRGRFKAMTLSYRIAEILADALYYAVLPALVIWSWVRLVRQPRVNGICPILSLVGLALGSASAILLIGMSLYALAMGGLPYYDPLSMKIDAWGSLVSFSALLFSIGGVWRPNSTRWHSTALSILVLFLWVVSMVAE